MSREQPPTSPSPASSTPNVPGNTPATPTVPSERSGQPAQDTRVPIGRGVPRAEAPRGGTEGRAQPAPGDAALVERTGATTPISGGGPAAGVVPSGPVEERYIFTPPIDIYETDEGLVLEADLPGVTSETLELQIQDNKLTLFGRVVPQAPAEALLRHEEYGVGDYLRSFILSDEVDHERISAKLANGVLRVVLPKAAKARPRRIEINTQ